MIYNKNTNCTGVIEKITVTDDSFKLTVNRNPSIDGRIGCGAGYDVKLSNDKNSFSCKFNNSKAAGEAQPNPEDILECVISDAYAYICAKDFYDFCSEFGYEPDKKAEKIYNSCKRTADNLSKMFTEKEMEKIDNWLRKRC